MSLGFVCTVISVMVSPSTCTLTRCIFFGRPFIVNPLERSIIPAKVAQSIVFFFV